MATEFHLYKKCPKTKQWKLQEEFIDSVKQSDIRDNSGKRMVYMNKDIVNHIIGREDAAVTQTEVVVQYSSYYSDCSTVLYIIILYSK